MTTISVLALLSAVFGFVSFLAPLSESCSMPVGWTPPTTVELMGWHERLILGKVIRKINDFRLYRSSTRYTAEVEVSCILRGERVPVLFNVTGAGYEAGLCYGTILEPGQTYIIGLDADGRASAPALGEKSFSEALQACNLNNPSVYPFGITSGNAKLLCPDGKEPGECKEH
jgi:hypothetical protein